MEAFFTFAGEHPIVTVFLAAILAHMPVAIIRALKNQPDQ